MKTMNKQNIKKTEYKNMTKTIKCNVISILNHVLYCQCMKKNTYNFCPFNNTF